MAGRQPVPYGRRVRLAPWNQDDADADGWANLFGGLALVGLGAALLVSALLAEPVEVRGVALSDGQAVLAGVVSLVVGGGLAAHGWGFRRRDRRERRRAAPRRTARRRTGRR